MSIWNTYTELYESEESEREIERRLSATEDRNISREEIEQAFDREAEMFMEKELLSKNEVNDVLHKLIVQIRSELKTEYN